MGSTKVNKNQGLPRCYYGGQTTNSRFYSRFLKYKSEVIEVL